MKKLLKVSLLSTATVLFAGCGGSGTASGSANNDSTVNTSTASILVSTDSQVKTPSSANVAVSGASAGSSCFALVQQPNSKNYLSNVSSSQYYSTANATFIIQNICSQAQSLSGLTINVNNNLNNLNNLNNFLKNNKMKHLYCIKHSFMYWRLL